MKPITSSLDKTVWKCEDYDPRTPSKFIYDVYDRDGIDGIVNYYGVPIKEHIVVRHWFRKFNARIVRVECMESLGYRFNVEVVLEGRV